MAYSVGSFHSMAELQAEIEGFAVTHGWTLTSGVLHKGGCAVKLGTPVAQSIQVEVSDSHDGSGNLIGEYAQELYLYEVFGGPTESSAGMVMLYPATFHLFEFSASDEIICVVEYNTHYVQQMSFGTIKKIGTWAGGVYGSATSANQGTKNPILSLGMSMYMGTNAGVGGMWVVINGTNWYEDLPNAVIKCDAVAGGTWIHNSTTTYDPGPPDRTFFTPVLMSNLFVNQVNPNTPVPYLIEPTIAVKQTTTSYSIVGTIPNVRHLNIANLELGDVIEVGNDRWKVFPMISKLHTGQVGYAVRYEGP